ncbi:MAG: AAA family ATPase [Gallionella sp.]|nr:AAA family ATPase [Gallionella sp.]
MANGRDQGKPPRETFGQSITRILGNTSESLSRLVQDMGRDYRDDEETASDPIHDSDTDQALGELTHAYVEAAETLVDMADDTRVYGTVLSVISPNPDHLTSSGRFNRVRVTASSAHPKRVNTVGYKLANDPPEQKATIILFHDGASLKFPKGDPKELLELVVDDRKAAIVACEGRIIEVLIPDKMELAIADTVKLNIATMQIIGKGTRSLAGQQVNVLSVADDGTCIVEFAQQERRVLVAPNLQPPLEAGDKVIVDPTSNVAVYNLGKHNVGFRLREIPKVTWNDIGGLKREKQLLRNAIEAMITHREFAEHLGLRPTRGILLLSLPGMGKGMLAEASAYSMMERYGEQAMQSGYFIVNGPEIYRPRVGVSEAILNAIFDDAERHFKQHGFPAIIFIDEAEAIGKKRGSGISSDHTDPLVLTLLTRLNKTTAIVIMATNRWDMMDEALMRPPRVDRKIYIQRPDRDTTQEIFAIHLKRVPLPEGETCESIAEYACELLYDPKLSLYRITVQEPDKAEVTNMDFCLHHLVSGALIGDGIVKKALDRRFEANVVSGKKNPVTRDDVQAAVRETFEEELPMEHDRALSAFTDDLTGRLLGVVKLKQSQ